MAGAGPAPKLPHERRNRSEPRRGEWVDLEPLEKPVLPPLPKRKPAWHPRTKTAWASWREDPVTSQYGPSDIQSAMDLLYLYEEWVRGRGDAAEIRQRQDRLGLNPKGKRDLRWRIPNQKVEPTRKAQAPTNSPRRARLSVVK